MNRRGFLQGILAAAAAPAIVKAASLMPVFVRKETGGLLVPGWPSEMAVGNQLLTIEQITREALQILHQNLGFIARIDRDYLDKFEMAGFVRNP